MNTSLFSKTPSVTVSDNRGLSVRNIEYHRHPDTATTTDERLTRHTFNASGFLTRSADPRLQAAGLANFTYITDLAGNVLRAQGVDSGITVSLSDVAGRPFIAVSNIGVTGDKSQAVTHTWQYEAASLAGRPLSVTEQVTGKTARITERFAYAGSSAAEKARNLAGACVSHYDPVGLEQTDAIALTGAPLSVTRRLLKDADNPDNVADWQGQDASAWNGLLATETLTTQSTSDATATVLTTTDATGNVQRVAYDVAGLLSGSWLTVKGGQEQVIVKSVTYSAAGQKLREEHGNGVVTTYAYEPETQRLAGIKTERPAGHASGAKVLQDLRYEYDPVGNVLKISNDAEETRFWRNQKVVPENTYVYDSLYQLVSATGREMANAGQQSSKLPSATVPLPTDSSAFTGYIRTYAYDNGGNLTQIRHNAAATNNRYTTDITISDRSNRGVLSTLAKNPSDVDGLFTPGGQQKQLQPGQNLTWTPRNELQQVSPVERDGGANDMESYRYDGGSQRLLKVSTQQTGNSTQTQRALYLPGLELRTTQTGSSETENLQVITVGEAGRAQVRVLHWAAGKPAGISNDQLRYSYDNLTGGSQLELDGSGNVISMEEYYPYGGTALWAARSQTEANYKMVCYSGKERDATGLYYYGYRYYQPWSGRWLSADPAGTVDGLNLFRMCRNNPVSLRDDAGLIGENAVELKHLAAKYEEGAEDEVGLARQVLKTAIEKLRQDKLDKETKERIREVFGRRSYLRKTKTSRIKDELLANFEHMREKLAVSRLFYDPDGAEQGAVAYVLRGEPGIFLTTNYFESLGSIDNVSTLMHESSHIKGIKRNNTFQEIYQEQPSMDYFYTDLKHGKDVGMHEYLQSAISGFKRFRSEFKDKSKRIAVTKRGDLSRQKIALHNADHLAITALSLGREHMKKPAVKQLKFAGPSYHNSVA